MSTALEVKATALREAAAEQRRLSEAARTNNGQAEHEDFADWLEERAGQMAGVPEGGEQDEARLGVVTDGQQVLGTCSPAPGETYTEYGVFVWHGSAQLLHRTFRKTDEVALWRRCNGDIEVASVRTREVTTHVGEWALLSGAGR